MSKTFTYKEGFITEKCEMEKPKREQFDFVLIYEFAMYDYKQHLATLRRFKYDYPDPGKEMELGKDFEVKDSTEGWTREYYPNGEVKRLEQVAIPITQRTYSEQDYPADIGLLILCIDEFLDDLHPIRHHSVYRKYKNLIDNGK